MECRWRLWHNMPQNYTLRKTNWDAITVKKPGPRRHQCRQLKRETEQSEAPKKVLKMERGVKLPRNRTTTTTIRKTTKRRGDQELSTRSVRHVVKQTTPQRKVTLEPTQEMDRFPRIKCRLDRSRINYVTHKTTQKRLSTRWSKL